MKAFLNFLFNKDQELIIKKMEVLKLALMANDRETSEFYLSKLRTL